MQPRSNRTFMELKWKPLTVLMSAIACSNRTFMELKSQYAEALRQGGEF